MTTLINDVKYAARVLWKQPGFTTIALITLAIGIGATTGIFSVVEAFLLRPLPYPDSGQLVSIHCEQSGAGQMNIGTSVPEFEDLRDEAGIFEELSMVFPMHGNLTGVDQPQRVEAMAVSTSYFRLLGGSAALGRTFGEEEEKVTGWAEGCVLSDGAWRQYFGGDPNVLERKFRMDYDTYRVIGVMPPDFRHPGQTLTSDVDVWFTGGMRTAPFRPEPQRNRRVIPGMLGRLKTDMTFAEAQARIQGFAVSTRQRFPDEYSVEGGWTPCMEPLQRTLVGSLRPILWLLFGAVVLVLLICCATLANLLLVRATGRHQELAIRCSLGASRGTLIRQLVVESLLLALCGGVAGMTLAWWLPQLVVAMAPVELPRVNGVGVNSNVLAFALAVSLITGILFSLIPALRASRVDLVTNLKDGQCRTGATRATQHLHTWFAGGQVALSLMLLTSAGLLLRSFWNALQVDPGFNADRVMVASLWLPPPTDPNARQTYFSHTNRVTLMREVQRRMRGLPGVEEVAIGTRSCLPLGGRFNTTALTIEGMPVLAGASPTGKISTVTPDYFHTLGIRLLSGRVFTETDDGEHRIALVNATAAKRFWRDQDPVGRRLALGTGADPQWWIIVGVVGDVKTEGLDVPDSPHIYLPAYQQSALGLTVFLRTAGNIGVWDEPIRREIHAIDPDLPVFGIRSLEDVVTRSLTQRRFAVQLIGIFAMVAFFLASLGIYGVVALTVSHRTREMGVRMALGANRFHILGLVLRQGLRVAAWGMGVGLVGTIVLARMIRGMLFNTDPSDPLTFIGIIFLLTTVALLACWIPARRAARVDPMKALRYE